MRKTIKENTRVIEYDFILAASFQNIKITYIVQYYIFVSTQT